MIDQQNAAPAEVLVRSDQIVTESLLSSTNGGASAVDSHSRLYNSGYNFPVLSNSVLTPSTWFHVKAFA
jgi:hypothetical protein